MSPPPSFACMRRLSARAGVCPRNNPPLAALERLLARRGLDLPADERAEVGPGGNLLALRVCAR